MRKQSVISASRDKHTLLRFCAASALLCELCGVQIFQHVKLHPALRVHLNLDHKNLSEISSEDLEAWLLAAWKKCEEDLEHFESRRAELLASLELTLVQDDVNFVRYLETVRSSLAPVDQADLWHLARALLRSPSIRNQAYRALFPEKILPADGSYKTPSMLTKTQALVAEKMIRLGQIFFNKNRAKFPIEPRLCPLLVGKTGAGKGYIILHVAKALCCQVIQITYGDWIVVGAHGNYSPTLWSIIETLRKNDRVVVVLDELDKFDANFVGAELSGWSRAACNELWCLLDRKLPISEYLKSPKSGSEVITGEEYLLGEKIKNALWIVGIGTWQHLHQPDPRSVGFAGILHGAKNRTIADKLAQGASGISAELLYRFNPQPLELAYPTHEELEFFLEATGVAAAARARGLILNIYEMDLSRGGMRVVEDLITKILIADADMI